MAKGKVVVSERALLARLNRKLAHEGLQIKKCRMNSRFYHDLGDYYIIDIRLNFIKSKDVDLKRLGKSENVLAGYEELEK